MRRLGGEQKPPLSFSRAMLLALFGFGALLFAGTFAMDATAAQPPDIGPLFVPRVFSGALMLFAAIEFVRRKAADENRIPYDRLVLVAMLLAIGYALALPVLGYVFSTSVTLAMVLFAIRAGRWVGILAFSVGLTAIIFFVFEHVMKVGLPAGPWGF